MGAYLDDGAVPNADGRYPAGSIHGYVWDDGRFIRLDVPGSRATSAVKIDNRGRVLGEFKDADGAIHGFLRDRGRDTILDHPRSTTDSTALDVTERGEILLQSPRMFGVVGGVE